MSENEESSKEAAERARKGKGKMISDDDQKEKEDATKIGDDSLSMYYMVLERDGVAGGFDDYVKEQQQAFESFELTNNLFQNPQIAGSPKEDSDGEAQIQDKDTDSTDSDAKTEEIKPDEIKPDEINPDEIKPDENKTGEQLIFDLQILEESRLVIPYAMASEHFPPMIISPNAEETLYLIDPRGERWQMTLTYNINANAYIITNGLNAYIDRNRLVRHDFIRVYLPIPQTDINNFHINHHRNCGPSLFEVRVSRSNRLRILCDLAVNYFIPMDAPLPPYHLNEFTLYLTDYLGRIWKMRYVVFDDEESYIIIRGWERYAAYHGLMPNDTIRFFRNLHPDAGINSFIVHHELIRRVRSINKDPVQTEELCWELCLTDLDVGFGRLKLTGFVIPSTTWRDREMVKLTDCNNKDWYVIMTYQRTSRLYLILDGWEDIVREHNLEAGDRMRIYEPPNEGDHDLHFVIQFGKKRKRKATEKQEDGSGSGKHNDGSGKHNDGSGKHNDGSGKPDDGTGSGNKIIKLG